MKTKKILLMAAMLLMSVCSFAQDNNTPLVGDVNEDGKVDIADIVAILNFMKEAGGTAGDSKYYFYVGTTKPTSLSQASVVESYPAEQTYTNNSGAKSHIFVLTNSDKNVTFINIATGNPVDQNEVDITTIPGYKIFETAVGTANTGSIKIRITDVAPTANYFYVGTTKPTSLSQASVVESYPAEQTYTNNSGAKAHIFVLTNSDKSVVFISPSENSPVTQVAVDTTTIPGYKIFETAVGTANTKSIIIRIS